MSDSELLPICRARRLPEALTAALAARGCTTLTPLQAGALAAGVDDPTGGDWLVLAPTGAGKSLVAMLAAARHLARGEAVLWLTPTRALAEAAAAELAPLVAALGTVTHCLTGERDADPLPDPQPDADTPLLIVAVYEKALSWLLGRPEAPAALGLAVADELSIVRDAERGPRIEALLALLATGPYAPRRIALAPPQSNAEELAAWLGARLLSSTQRSRPLHETVYDMESRCWLSREGVPCPPQVGLPSALPAEWLERGAAAAALAGVDRREDSAMPAGLLALAMELAGRGEPTLLFVPTRWLARRCSAALARVAELPPAPEVLLERARRLARLEPEGDHTLLAETLAAGVALHHADLSAAARRLVESAFAPRLDQAPQPPFLLIATPTLAQGLNLTARHVLHWPRRFEWRAGGLREAPLEVWRYHDQAGRAGRLGCGPATAPGTSLLVAGQARAAARLARVYLTGPAEPLRPAACTGAASVDSLTPEALAPAVLAALANRTARTRDNLLMFLGVTFSGWLLRQSAGGAERLAALLDRALAQAAAAHLLRRDEDPAEPLRLTPAGELAARHGLTPKLAARLQRLLDQHDDPALAATALTAHEPAAALWSLAVLAPAAVWPVGAARQSAIATRVRLHFIAQGLDLPRGLDALLNRPGGPSARELAGLEAGWRLARWAGAEATPEIEAATGWPAGMLARAGEAIGWLARALAALGALRGLDSAWLEGWRTLAVRAELGLNAKAAGLAPLHGAVDGVERTILQRLAQEGYQTMEAVASAPGADLARLLGNLTVAERLIRAAKQRTDGRPIQNPLLTAMRSNRPGGDRDLARAADPAGAAVSPPSAPTPPPAPHWPRLELSMENPGVIRVIRETGAGEVVLPYLPWLLLVTLAEAPGKVFRREQLYDVLWPGGGPEPQQLDAHRRSVRGALVPVMPGAPPPIENLRGIGFRLALPPEQITRTDLKTASPHAA